MYLNLKSNSIVIECKNELSGSIEVVYAGYESNGTGNVRDSDGFNSLYKYYDDSSDSPKENYTPKDEQGNLIYGKRYPMYNWLVSFYKKLN